MSRFLDSIKGKLVFATIAFAIVSMAFLAGAGLHKLNKWPFGQGYYNSIKAMVRATPKDESPPKIIVSTLLNFDIVLHKGSGRIFGGGLAVTDGGVLIAKGVRRELHYYDKAADELYEIALKLPDNNHHALPNETADARKVNTNWHRYNDVEFIRVNGVLSLLASYTHYDPKRSCFTNRLAVHELKNDWNLPVGDRGADTQDDWQGDLQGDWRVVFETQPCLPFLTEGLPFAGNQAGGRLAVASDGAIYLTVGDFRFDGVSGTGHSQRPDSDYGKILRIDPADWSVEQVSLGHRNPQGIVIDGQGRVWSVEHGPMGGDELNLIKDGEDYGWPSVTLGVNYTDKEDDNKRWPPSANQGRHDGYVQPVLAWVPSIGISNLKQVKNIHPRWDGDLLASSLKGTLRRIRLSGDRVLYEESIPFDGCIRYVETGDEALYVLFCDGNFARLTPRIGEILAAETLAAEMTGSAFKAREDANALQSNGCFECHSNAGTASLSRVFGAKIASQSGVNYSESLRKQSGNWSETNLRAFLADPQTFAPGTNMPKTSLSSQQTDEIIQALMPKGAERDPHSSPDL